MSAPSPICVSSCERVPDYVASDEGVRPLRYFSPGVPVGRAPIMNKLQMMKMIIHVIKMCFVSLIICVPAGGCLPCVT